MRAYADTLMAAFADHAPDVVPELIELNPSPMNGVWGQRIQTVLMPSRAWLQRNRKPDLWHVLDGSRAYIARALAQAPVAITAHDIIPWLQANGRFPGSPPIGRAAARLWRRNGREMRRAARLICVSECTARDASQEFGCERENLQVVPNPLRPGMATRAREAMARERHSGVVLHVGNNGFYKNREGVLRIYARLDGNHAQRLLMAGPAPTEELLRLVHALGLAGRVEWHGDPDDDALASLYRRASVLLFPSIYEGFGWPVLEAMALGLPVIVSDRGSLAEVVGNAGACLPLNDEAGFVSAVNRILGSPETAIDLSKRGLARAGEFGAAIFARRMHEAYSAAIATHQGTGT